jgi:serine palmitoyltransferase
LVEDWTPEPLVAKITPFEEAEIEKRAVIVGYAAYASLLLLPHTVCD